MHYVRSILFDAAVVILTLVVSLSVPFLWLFKASSATVRAVSQVWANGIMLLMKYVVGPGLHGCPGARTFRTDHASSPAIISRCGRPPRSA